MKIFVSYTSADKDWAEWVAWHLEENGHEATIQDWDFKAGSNFVINMQEAAQSCDITIAILSNEYLNKPFATAEWAAAFSKDPDGQFSSLIPVRVADVKPEGLLKSIVYIDLFKCHDESSAIDSLIDGVSSGRKKPSHAPVFPKPDSPRIKQPAYPNRSRPPYNGRLSEVKQLSKELFVCRKDQYGKSRRRALNNIIERLDKLPKNSFEEMELQVQLWKQKMKESRNREDYIVSVENVQSSFDELFSYSLNEEQEYTSTLLLVEWAIDFSQAASTSFDINKIVSRLNNAIKLLGMKIGLDTHAKRSESITSNLLCLRAKCRRALASTYQKRLGLGRKSRLDVYRMRADALSDAERSYALCQNGMTKLELSLCLFSNSATTESENAKKGMSILTEAHKDDFNIFASYELIKQLRMRHKFEEAIIIFIKISELDKDRRRHHESVTHFAASVIGLYYSNENKEQVKEYGLEACRLLEEVISCDHHKAREIVDLCYLQAICGFPIKDSITALNALKPTEDIPWSELANMAQNKSNGQADLEEALFLGLEDPAIWGRIGTFYSDFCRNYDRALEFYGYASTIDRSSPVYHFNKARIFAYKQLCYEGGKLEIDYALHLKKNKYGWYKNNKEEIIEVKSAIDRLKNRN